MLKPRTPRYSTMLNYLQGVPKVHPGRKNSKIFIKIQILYRMSNPSVKINVNVYQFLTLKLNSLLYNWILSKIKKNFSCRRDFWDTLYKDTLYIYISLVFIVCNAVDFRDKGYGESFTFKYREG